MKEHLTRHFTKYFLALLVVVYIVLRLPGIHTSYYQDEYKWPLYANPAYYPPGSVPHTPLTELIVVQANNFFFGPDNFRVMPFLFGIVNIFLVFYLAKLIFGKREAMVSAGLFVVSFFSILSSLMIDTDGQILPFFMLCMFISYFRWQRALTKKSKTGWAIAIGAAAMLGFLTKASFIIPIVALMIDFLYERRIQVRQQLWKYASALIGIVIGMILLLVVAQVFFPFFDLSKALVYWKHFIIFKDRNIFQVMVQFLKAILYLSPLLLLPVFLSKKEEFKKAQLLWLFLGVGLIFYLVLFDFSIGALDRYLQYLIVPLCIIVAPIFVRTFREDIRPVPYWFFQTIAVLALGLFALQLVSHFAPPLYPKTEFVSRAAQLKWNFVFPFNGGSGPLGFYMSFLFMAATWVVGIALVALIYFKKHLRKSLMLALIVIGLLYNAMFLEEYLFGKVYGSTRTLLKDAIGYIQNNDSIKMVTTYNDIGGYELRMMGKYRKRLYIDPKFDIQEKLTSLNTYKEHYLVVEIPTIDKDTIYARYFATCSPMYRETSRKISATVYDCTKAPDISL